MLESDYKKLKKLKKKLERKHRIPFSYSEIIRRLIR